MLSCPWLDGDIKMGFGLSWGGRVWVVVGTAGEKGKPTGWLHSQLGGGLLNLDFAFGGAISSFSYPQSVPQQNSGFAEGGSSSHCTCATTKAPCVCVCVGGVLPCALSSRHTPVLIFLPASQGLHGPIGPGHLGRAAPRVEALLLPAKRLCVPM